MALRLLAGTIAPSAKPVQVVQNCSPRTEHTPPHDSLARSLPRQRGPRVALAAPECCCAVPGGVVVLNHSTNHPQVYDRLSMLASPLASFLIPAMSTACDPLSDWAAWPQLRWFDSSTGAVHCPHRRYLLRQGRYRTAFVRMAGQLASKRVHTHLWSNGKAHRSRQVRLGSTYLPAMLVGADGSRPIPTKGANRRP